MLFMGHSNCWLKFLVIFVIMKWICSIVSLTLIWVGFLGVRFEVGRGGGKITSNYPTSPCLKLVRITLETSNLASKYTHIRNFRKFTFQYQDSLNFADVSIFCKKSAFLAKIVPLLKAIVWDLCQRYFSSVFSFGKIKIYY